MTTYYVFGDTGGHYNQLYAGLMQAGVNPTTYKIPDDVVIIHEGDLIHKGPDSLEILQLVDVIMRANPGQWIQLLGNHEFQYFNGSPFFWGDVIPGEGQAILRDWALDGLVRVAFAIEAPATIHGVDVPATAVNKPILFTHSGVTRGFWEMYLKEAEDIYSTVELINNLPVKVVTRPGQMLDGGAKRNPLLPVGPTWALSTFEVFGSWRDQTTVPFIQVHGHTNAYNFFTNKWWDAFGVFKEQSVLDKKNRRVVTKVADSIQIAVDPGYEKTAPNHTQPSLKITT